MAKEKNNSFDSLVRKIKGLRKRKEVRKLVEKRLLEFQDFEKKSDEKWFSELCYCLLTAGSSAKSAMKAQQEIGKGFLCFPKKKLASELKKSGYRFYNARAGYICRARKFLNVKKEILRFKFEDSKKAREWLVRNVYGLGFKEASHFLRNVGFGDVAIADRHILSLLKEYKIIDTKQKLNYKSYLLIEKKLEEIARKIKMSLAELDLYLWYMKTGQVLK